MTSAPIIDVLIPVFNGAATLKTAVESILAQTVRNIRIIVVDDGSTDQTPAILSQMTQADSRIAVVSKPNSGIVDTLNIGIARCECDYVARMDADDIAYPDRLARQLDYLKSNPDCVAVGGRVQHIDENGTPIYGLPHPGPPAHADASWVPAREPYLIHPFLFGQRAPILSVGGYRFVHNSEDSDLFWRLAELGRLHNLDEALGQYRVHIGSISSASILNGRIMAVNSQLAAISAKRRKAGQQDLTFFQQSAEAYRSGKTLEKIYKIASNNLDPLEKNYLRIASAAKLMELAGYRQYELEMSDCVFIRGALPYVEPLPLQNKKEFHWYLTVAAARLLRKARLNEMLTLVPPTFLPIVAARALLSRSARKTSTEKS